MQDSSLPKKHHRLFSNRLMLPFLCLYFFLLLITTFFSCFFSFKQKRGELMSEISSTYSQLSQEYTDITDNFWQLYMPIFDTTSSSYDILQDYFVTNINTVLSPFEKNSLEGTLKQILLRDDELKWIVIFSPNREDNYILFSDSPGLKLVTDDFPYMSELKSKSRKMNVYAQKTIEYPVKEYNTFAISGSIPSSMGAGNIMVGYSTSRFYTACDNNGSTLDSLDFVLINNNSVLFDYKNSYQDNYLDQLLINQSNCFYTNSGEKMFGRVEKCSSNTSFLAYYVSKKEFNKYCHRNTPILILLFLSFALSTFIGYLLVLRIVKKEIFIINNGLNEIGENNLDFCLPEKYHQNGLSEIACSINRMTVRLKENVNRAYYYELKQREAEMSELRSKFNPHFLYNSLEMLRSRCQLNGDDATAEIISQLSAIFRGFIGSKNFIPLAEELSYSKNYLSLFGARYEDRVKIRYDFDKDILKYGIIRNLYQPLIENYFVHGFDTSNDENFILFRGKSVNDKMYMLTIEDNGSGMSDEDIAALNAKLNETIQISTESYGLKNLHQRLKLFYGEDCGLIISHNVNASKGLCIQITVPKITCEDYESQSNHL